MGRMEVFYAELWVIGVALPKCVARVEALRAHGVTTVAVFSYSQAAIRRTIHLDSGPGQHFARAINERARALRAYSIEVMIHCVLGHAGIRGNEEADCQANKAREDQGDTVHERIYTSAANRARRISEGRTVAMAQWEANKWSKHYGYSLNGKARSKRSVPMTRMKSLATRFYRPKSRHVPIGTYIKRFGHREDTNASRAVAEAGRRPLTWDHLFHHCSRWRDQQKAQWKEVGKATGWNAGRCRPVQISELFSIEEGDQAVMNFMAATEVGKFPPK